MKGCPSSPQAPLPSLWPSGWFFKASQGRFGAFELSPGQDEARHQLRLSWLWRAGLLPKNTTSGHLLCLLATPHRAAVLSCLSEMPQHDFCPKPTPTPLPTVTQDHSTAPVTDPDRLFSLTDPQNPQLPPPSVSSSAQAPAPCSLLTDASLAWGFLSLALF